MKKPAALFVLLAAASANAAEQGGVVPLTLDPTLYTEALREVQGANPLPAPGVKKEAVAEPEGTGESPVPQPKAPVSSAPGVEDWQAAMRDAGTELADVRLLVLLQRLNPLDPPAARAEDYAAALRLHHLMLAGNARACLALARACREGHFESGLLFIQSEALSAVLERRAAAFQLAIPAPPAGEAGREEAPAPEGRGA